MKLTDEQRAIVEHEGGHARVLAVAGSGKTFTMGHRIAYLTQEKKVMPRRIRVLMFNRLAREQFVDRLKKLGFSEKGLPHVSTFHSFAFQFVMYLHKKGLSPKKEFWTGDNEEKRRILLHNVLDELRKERAIPPKNHPDGSFDIEEVLDTIGLYKGSLIPPKNAGHKYNEFIPAIYKRYEQRRNEANALTYDDFVPAVISVLGKNEELRNQWAAKADYLIVDEYQDVNYGQQKLIEILAGKRAEVMVVGDDDQTIYEWRGARPNFIIRDFMSVFSNYPHSTYNLSCSFRFGPMIAQAAQNSILHNTNRVSKELIAFRADLESDIFLYRGATGGMTEIYRDMGQEIVRLVKRENVPPKEIWVLGRMYAQFVGLEIMLLTFKVPYRVLGNKPFFERSEIKKLLSYLNLGGYLDKRVSKSGAKEFLDILNYPNRMISRKRLNDPLERAVAQKSSWADLLAWMVSDRGEEELDLDYEQRENLRSLIGLIQYISRCANAPSGENTTIAGLLEKIVKTTGLNTHFENYYGKGEASFERKSMIDGFIQFASTLNLGVREFIQFISKLDPTKGAPEDQLITLSTVHRTKGLEFDYVFIPSCIEGFMPSLIGSVTAIYDKKHPKREDEASLAIENERRLFYVALTRARKATYIATIKPDEVNGNILPSRFLEEILYEACTDTLKNIARVKSWPEQKRKEWIQKVRSHAGRPSLVQNIEKYLLQLDARSLQKEVARINASATPAPFKYSYAYKNLDEAESPEQDYRDSGMNFWGDVEEV